MKTFKIKYEVMTEHFKNRSVKEKSSKVEAKTEMLAVAQIKQRELMLNKRAFIYIQPINEM